MIESFPRMWDQRQRNSQPRFRCRIIPTYVGSTGIGDTSSLERPNHSHVCGINLWVSLDHVHKSESFPRMWDQRIEELEAENRSRIIPTYVGSTNYLFKGVLSIPNHSHVCGINFFTSLELFWTGESFPRMWDQRTALQIADARNRIIPTYVGSTRIINTFTCVETNHSHVCGINSNSSS